MIFNLFKSKPTLGELIPNGFIDIHSHILPEIDDGAKNVEESVKLITEMKKMGFVKAIATPHTYHGIYNNTEHSIKESFDKLNEKKIDGIKLEYASEYMVDNSLNELISNSTLLAIKKKYILIEMSYIGFSENIYEILFLLQTKGYIPILAHPERYNYLHENFKEYHKLVKFGCKFQINILSLSGYYGYPVMKTAEKLINKHMVDFMGTDIHNLNHIKEIKRRKLGTKKSIIGKINQIFQNNIKYFD